MAKTVEDTFRKYRNNLSNAGEYIKKGVMNTDKDQAANAIKQKDYMIQRHREAMDRGDWERNLRASGHAGWQKGMIEKGVNNIIPGVDSAQDKIKASLEAGLINGKSVQDAVKDMPKGGVENATARVRKAIETTMKNYGKL